MSDRKTVAFTTLLNVAPASCSDSLCLVAFRQSVDLQDVRHVVQGLHRLLLQALHHLTSVGAEPNLTGDVEDVVHSHGLVVRTNRSGSFRTSVDYSVVSGPRLVPGDNLE